MAIKKHCIIRKKGHFFGRCRNLSPRGDGNVLVLAFVVGLVSRNLSLYGDVSNAKGTYDPSNPSNLSLNVVLFINLIISPK